MLGTWAEYLFGGSENQPRGAAAAAAPATPQQGDVPPCREVRDTDPELDEWVIIAEGASPAPSSGTTPACSTSPSTPTSQMTVEDNWTLTPPACFPGGRPPLPPASSLENLLIEHPSMSVYVRSYQEEPPVVGSRSRSVSVGPEVPEPREPAAPVARRGAAHPTQQGAATPAQALHLQRLAVIKRTQRDAGKVQRKQLHPAALQRANTAREVKSGGNQRLRRSQHTGARHSGANNNRKC